MSNDVVTQLRKYPLLLRYAKSGLVNLMALSRLLKSGNDAPSLEALGMELRRYIAKSHVPPMQAFDFSPYSLQLISRSNIREVILDASEGNRKKALEVAHEITGSKYFVSMMRGEKEIVIMTDYPSKDLLNLKGIKPLITHQTDGLGFVSVDFPIEMRHIPGIYSIVTSALSESEVSIHAFHTIGGEIIILFQEKDLLRAQEVIGSLF